MSNTVLKVNLMQEGNLLVARVEGRENIVIGSITVAGCAQDETVFEDFQALVVKATSALVNLSGPNLKVVSYRADMPRASKD